MQKKFEFIEHTADVGIVVYGRNFEELFENAALGMYNVVCENFKQIEEKISYKSNLEDTELESLLVSFLNDLIYQTFVNKILFSKFVANVCAEKKYVVEYTCFGEIYQPQKHGKLTELKAATYHQLKIQKEQDIYTTKIIFDI